MSSFAPFKRFRSSETKTILRERPECVVLPAEGASDAAPVRIFLGTEPAQWRAERVFMASVVEHRNPERRYEIYRMEALRGFDRRNWTTGFTGYRFAIPSFAGCEGRAIYNDVDQLYLADPGELFVQELGDHGYLALSARETSVMLLDCARMAEVWSLEIAGQLEKKELSDRAARVPGLLGPLAPEWNARDGEYEEGKSKLVHYTTLHTQPWRPFPERFAYREGPGAELWKAAELCADEASYESFSKERPSEAMASGGERLFPSDALPANRQVLRMLARLTPGDQVLELEGKELHRWLFEARPESAGGILVPGGIEALPEVDQGWVLRRLFEGARRFLFVAAAPGAGSARFVERFEGVARSYRAVHWELFVRDEKGRMRHAEGGRFLGRKTPRTWVVVDDRAGNETQAVGLAEELGWDYQLIRLRFGRLGDLHPRLRGASRVGLSRKECEKLAAPWPDLVISAGRRAAPVARWVRERAQGRTRLVHLGRKGGAAAGLFDLVVTPRHARLWPHPRRIETLLPLSRVNDAELAKAADRWKDTLSTEAGSPRVAVLVGGETRKYRLGPSEARQLAVEALALTRRLRGQLWVTTSPRTGAAATEALAQALGKDAKFFPWQSGTETPYLGLLAEADLLIVTGETESMLAEACATDRPVMVFPLPRISMARGGRGIGGRIVDALLARAAAEIPNDRGTVRPQKGLARWVARWTDAGVLRPTRDLDGLHADLVRAGRLQTFGAEPRLEPVTPHREAADVASRLRQLMGVDPA
ncbi:MAG: mitochondrial fission ELM1 family protein [Deltaproteobacteria bacterium]|nr:mitochondrial fission ELM1 family protein [Deltaproteobacteria bacterium]MBW2396125.1 mitochondrial fission ELM1 family protein [Deltaproteobacteria bacterium]